MILTQWKTLRVVPLVRISNVKMKDEISIVIPVFNEEKTIASTVEKLQQPEVKEIIVVDGGSTDMTISVAEQAGCIVIRSDRKGRAYQMNIGAALARSSILYFLHSDTIPPVGFAKKIIYALRQGADYGCFSLNFDEPSRILQFFARFTRLNLKWVRFGDQSLFVKKTLFSKIGGFDQALYVMEDQEIYNRLSKAGQFKLIDDPVQTSARKYRKIGVIKLQIIFSIIYTGYYMGMNQRTLLHFYKKQTRTDE